MLKYLRAERQRLSTETATAILFFRVARLLFRFWDDLDKTDSGRFVRFSVRSSHPVQFGIGYLFPAHRSGP